MGLDALLPLLLAVVVGAVLGWLAATTVQGRRLERDLMAGTARASAAETSADLERQRREQLQAELEETHRRLQQLDRDIAVARERELKAAQLIEQLKAFSERSREELEDTFKALAAEALAGSSKQFLDLARARLSTGEERARADLEERQKAIESMLEPLKETLGRLDSKAEQIEKARVDAYSRIDQQVQMLVQATATLQEKTTTLATALKSSQIRGRWGEIALRNVAELAGMTEHCDFEEQTTAGDGRRPDMTVHLPGGRKIAVDAKAPLTHFLKAAEATDEQAREAALDRHVKALRGHIKTLADRNYAEALGSELDLVVMFLPGDPILSAVFSRDPEVQVEALRSRVLIATPTTLVALLRTVAIYWQQRSLAENAETIATAARELYQRAAKFSGDLEKIGRGLSSALKAYNEAVGSFDRRLLPMGRRLEELRVAEQTKRDLASPETIEDEPRRLGS